MIFHLNYKLIKLIKLNSKRIIPSAERYCLQLIYQHCIVYIKMTPKLKARESTTLYALLLLICHTQVSGKIQEWERSCVVGECVSAKSAYTSCTAQPLDVLLGHPTKSNVRSESVFKNRPHTLSAETCHHDGRTGYIPICCPEERKTVESMLIAGLGAGLNEFPHQVRVLINSPTGVREKCGGTIYSKDYILTAASCLVYNGVRVKPSDVQVIAGQNLEHSKAQNNIHEVLDIKIHEGYKGTVHTYGIDHDIALLRLSRPLDLSSRSSHQGVHLKALRIPEKGFRADGRRAIVLGWGRTAVEAKPIGALLKMNSYINTNEECERKSQVALKNGNDLRKTKLQAETPHDEFGHPETFEISKTTFASKSSNRNLGGGSRHSLFDDDDFFKWGSRRRSSLDEWGKTHEFVTLGALRLGKLWEGGVEYRNSRGSHLQPMPASFPKTLLCLGGGGESIGYSRGDTGGPAICEGPDGAPVLCGISSYGRNEFRGEWPATFTFVAKYVDFIQSHAGRQSEDTLLKQVIDGQPISTPDEASFFIRIRNKKTNATCGGALINSKTVISSVACVPLDVDTTDLVLTSGEYSMEHKGTEHEIEGVATRETYKNYRSRSENRRADSTEVPEAGTLRGDFPQLNLAVLKLYRPARGVKPIDLVKPGMDSTIAYEYGWRNDGRDMAINKWGYREVPLEECKAKYGAVGIQVDEIHLCATEEYSGGDRCNSELGNPLICVDRLGKKYLCGVTSIRDCSYSLPTIFTNMVKNLNWIQL